MHVVGRYAALRGRIQRRTQIRATIQLATQPTSRTLRACEGLLWNLWLPPKILRRLRETPLLTHAPPPTPARARAAAAAARLIRIALYCARENVKKQTQTQTDTDTQRQTRC